MHVYDALDVDVRVQIVRDVITVSEGTNWRTRCPTEAKLRALRCQIEILHPSDYGPILKMMDCADDTDLRYTYSLCTQVEVF